MKDILVTLRLSLIATLSLGVLVSFIYPMLVWGFAQVLFPHKANGSLIEMNGKIMGSALLGQVATSPQYFHSRPSAAGKGYDGASSSGSNFGPISEKFINGVADTAETKDVDESFTGLKQRVENYRLLNRLSPEEKIPPDAVTASASGLDPHISPRNAELQIARVGEARGMDRETLQGLIREATEAPDFGIFGEPRVHVLQLNLALDKAAQ